MKTFAALGVSAPGLAASPSIVVRAAAIAGVRGEALGALARRPVSARVGVGSSRIHVR